MPTAFNAGAVGPKNVQTLLILRFFGGASGSSPLTNAGMYYVPQRSNEEADPFM